MACKQESENSWKLLLLQDDKLASARKYNPVTLRLFMRIISWLSRNNSCLHVIPVVLDLSTSQILWLTFCVILIDRLD